MSRPLSQLIGTCQRGTREGMISVVLLKIVREWLGHGRLRLKIYLFWLCVRVYVPLVVVTGDMLVVGVLLNF